MRRGLTRAGAAMLALAVVAAAATCRKRDDDHGGHPSDAAGVCATPCNQILVVGADGALSCGDATIQIGVNEVAWRTASATSKLQITFDAPSPFPNLRCSNGICVSGPVDPNALPSGTNSKTFGYTAMLTSSEGERAGESSATTTTSSSSATSSATPTPTPSAKTALGRIIIQR
jgi:hypothetical protein